MGIAVKELLTLEYFKDYHVIAGKSGLHKEIQGTTLLEAPDALRWAKGKELILSSGYVLAQEPDCLEEAFKSGSMQGTSVMMIKRGRYLDEIPQRLIDSFSPRLHRKRCQETLLSGKYPRNFHKYSLSIHSIPPM